MQNLVPEVLRIFHIYGKDFLRRMIDYTNLIDSKQVSREYANYTEHR